MDSDDLDGHGPLPGTRFNSFYSILQKIYSLLIRFLRRIPRQAGQQSLDPDAADPANQIAIHQSIFYSSWQIDKPRSQSTISVFLTKMKSSTFEIMEKDKQADAWSDNKNGNSNNNYRW